MLTQRIIFEARLALIPDSGHYPVIQQPEAFAETLRTFTEETRDGD